MKMIGVNLTLVMFQAGLGYILKQVAPDFLRAILTMLGIDQEMYDPVCKLSWFCIFASILATVL